MTGSFSPLARLLFAGWLPLVSVAAARADVDKFEFRLVETAVKTGDGVVAVRIVNKSTGEPVRDAVIFTRRLEMAPEDMPTMSADLEPVPADEPGVYRFKTNFTMQGGWQLSLAAKIQGESGTLQGRLRLKAAP